MFWTLFILALGFVGIAFIGLGIQTFFSKKRTFPETKVGHNKAMRKNKIFCIKTQQAVIDKNYKQKQKTDRLECSGC